MDVWWFCLISPMHQSISITYRRPHMYVRINLSRTALSGSFPQLRLWRAEFWVHEFLRSKLTDAPHGRFLGTLLLRPFFWVGWGPPARMPSRNSQDWSAHKKKHSVPSIRGGPWFAADGWSKRLQFQRFIGHDSHTWVVGQDPNLEAKVYPSWRRFPRIQNPSCKTCNPWFKGVKLTPQPKTTAQKSHPIATKMGS